MSEYPNWEKLERLLETDPAALKYLLGIQKDFVNRWVVLRAKMGRYCNVPGTKVLTSSRGYVPIEELDQNKDLIIPWNQSFYGAGKPQKFTLHERDYNGQIVTISAGGNEYKCTSDHLCLASWNDNCKQVFIVYLMRRGNYWRVGKSTLFITNKKTGRRSTGLIGRARQEKADDAWILGVYKTNTESLLAEEYYSVISQTAKALFIASDKDEIKYNGLYKWVTQDQLDMHHQRMCKPISHYETFLASVNKSIHYPDWSASCDRRAFEGTKGHYDISAYNIIEGYMSVPVVVGDIRYLNWTEFKPISKKIEPYNGVVFSLNVEKYHTYIANGIATHNCPMARGVLKALCAIERDNKLLCDSIEAGKFIGNG